MSTAEPRSNASLLSKQQFLSMYLPSLVFSLGHGIVIPVLPVYAKSFGLSFGVSSLAFIVYQVGSLVAALPAGYLIDKIGRKPVLISGPIVIALASFLTAIAQSFPELLVYRFIGGCAEPLWLQSRLALIADTSVDRERGRQVAWMVGLQRGGTLFGPAVGGFLAELWGVRVPFIFYGFLVLLVIIPSFKLIKETVQFQPRRQAGDPPVAQTATAEPAAKTLLQVFMQPQIIAFLVLSFLANLSRTAFQGGGIALYAVYSYGVGPGLLAVVTTLATTLSLPVPFVTGYIMDRMGRKWVIVPAYIVSASGLGFITLTTLGPTPLIFVLGAILYAHIAQSPTSGTMQTLATDLAPSGSRGRFLSIWRVVSHGANVTGPALIAILVERVSYTAAFGVITVAGLCTSLFAAVLVKETVPRVQPPSARTPVEA